MVWFSWIFSERVKEYIFTYFIKKQFSLSHVFQKEFSEFPERDLTVSSEIKYGWSLYFYFRDNKHLCYGNSPLLRKDNYHKKFWEIWFQY